MSMTRIVFILIYSSIYVVKCFGQPVIVADAGKQNINIGKMISVFTDTSGKLSYQDVSAPGFRNKFKQSEQNVPDFGAESAPVWCRFLIKNSYGERLLLAIENTELEWIDLYIPQRDSVIKKSLSAYNRFNKREISVNQNLFLLEIPKDSVQLFYLRVMTNTGLQFPLRVSSLEKKLSAVQLSNILYGIYIGFMILMILYNFFIYSSLKDSAYLFYVLYVLFMTLTNVIEEGLAFEYLWPNTPQLNHYVNIIACLAGSFAILFSAVFLHTRENAKRLHRFFYLLIFCYGACVMIILSGNRFLGMITTEFVSLVAVVSLFLTGIVVYRKGFKPAKYYLIAWTTLLIGVLVFLLKDFNIVPYNQITVSGMRIGSGIEALLLSFALANKINTYREEKEKAEVLAFAQAKENEKLVVEQNVILETKVTERTKELKHLLEELSETQSQLIQKEKLASLGELTAGIAHEIQNPLNFVNNFSDINKELIAEMDSEIDKGNLSEAKSIAKDVAENEEKINHHGKRADAIVKGMLQHSRTSTGQKEPTDINALADEYLRLSYHGLRAKDSSFNATMKTDFDESIGKINIIPQDIGRVLLNLYNNAFYAITERKMESGDNYQPTIFVSTRKINDKIEIKVKDNGDGIPLKIIDKIFQPFFTTKPAGQGTGLGLSLSYDIIKVHGGEIQVKTKEGEGSEFIIQLHAA
ncbi:MAG TPA: 7TM diverse intracellular signaling domain-containing protein [Puia sp.]|nr:7TM diverse intracellular signaling domain-containing protein [Puia sp.]